MRTSCLEVKFLQDDTSTNLNVQLSRIDIARECGEKDLWFVDMCFLIFVAEFC